MEWFVEFALTSQTAVSLSAEAKNARGECNVALSQGDTLTLGVHGDGRMFMRAVHGGGCSQHFDVRFVIVRCAKRNVMTPLTLKRIGVGDESALAA